MTIVSVILMVMMKTMMTIVVIHNNNNCIYSVKFQYFAQLWQLVNSFFYNCCWCHVCEFCPLKLMVTKSNR